MQAVVCPVQRCTPCAIHGKRRCALVAAQQATYYLCSPAGGCHRWDGQTVRARAHKQRLCLEGTSQVEWSVAARIGDSRIGTKGQEALHYAHLAACAAHMQGRPPSVVSLVDPHAPLPHNCCNPARVSHLHPPLRQAEVLRCRCDRYLCSSHEGSVWCPGGRGSLICRRPLHVLLCSPFSFAQKKKKIKGNSGAVILTQQGATLQINSSITSTRHERQAILCGRQLEGGMCE
jgi:hypothetical protein